MLTLLPYFCLISHIMVENSVLYVLAVRQSITFEAPTSLRSFAIS